MNVNELMGLLPAIYRLRDDEQGHALQALLQVVAEQVDGLQESLAQLYDDQFIETAAAWATPYIGDLIGYRSLAGASGGSTPRSEVANTIGYRRRKGTAAMLEQLARDVTGWDASVVEFFQRLATTQYMNHSRPDNHYAPHLRQSEVLEAIGTPFDTVAHTADVRRIAPRPAGRPRAAASHSKYNIPNVGIFLWRVAEHRLTRSPAVGLGDGRFWCHPLGVDAALYNDARPVADFAGLATTENVPQPITRRAMARQLDVFYGLGRSFLIEIHPVLADGVIDAGAPGAPIPVSDLMVCNLSDIPDGAGGVTWAHLPVPAGKVAVDPVLGRLAFGTAPAGMVLVTFYYGFPAEIGGGEYERGATFQAHLAPVTPISMPGPLQDALTALAPGGVVQIQDSGRYPERLGLTLDAGAHAEVRARNGSRPTIVLDGDWLIDGGEGSELTLNGLLITGGALRVAGKLARVRLVHCSVMGDLIVEQAGVSVEVMRSVTQALRIHPESTATVEDSIVDAGDQANWAYSGSAGAAGAGPGGSFTVNGSTVVGRVHAREMPLASNAIFAARVGPPPEPDAGPPVEDGAATAALPVRVDQRQEGCVRFSYVPPGSRTPRRHRCQPAAGAPTPGGDPQRVQPQFTSLRYADASYGQLSLRCATEIVTGADDEGEMGAYHHLLAQQRIANLRVRLDEYLRFGLEAGVFFVS